MYHDEKLIVKHTSSIMSSSLNAILLSIPGLKFFFIIKHYCTCFVLVRGTLPDNLCECPSFYVQNVYSSIDHNNMGKYKWPKLLYIEHKKGSQMMANSPNKISTVNRK